jgi:hypothetical protein
VAGAPVRQARGVQRRTWDCALLHIADLIELAIGCKCPRLFLRFLQIQSMLPGVPLSASRAPAVNMQRTLHVMQRF